jgi:hypothetical protein
MVLSHPVRDEFSISTAITMIKCASIDDLLLPGPELSC